MPGLRACQGAVGNPLTAPRPYRLQCAEEYATLMRKTGRKNEGKAMERRAKAIRQSYAAEDLGRHTIDMRDLSTFRDNGAS